MAELSDDRTFNFTASKAPTVVNGTASQVLERYQIDIGDLPDPDLSDVFEVQLGKHVEEFCISWHEHDIGHFITERQRFVRHPKLSDVSATIDGYDATDQAVIEFKCLNAYRKRKEFIAWYTPQVMVQMACRGVERGFLLVLQGNTLTKYDILLDDEYRKQAWDRINSYRLCVASRLPPFPMPGPLIPPEQWKSINLNAEPMPLPNWAGPIQSAMALWATTKESHALNEQARADIKALLPGDVGELLWNEIALIRNRKGAITIKREVAP